MVRAVAGAGLVSAVAAGTASAETAKSKFNDEDGNDIPDEGEVVTGTYKSYYVYDASGAYHWDLGDGRVYGVQNVDDLDQSTLTVCTYKNQYRGTYGNDPFLNSGWIMNQIHCQGYDGNGVYKYTIVHETDPRHTGEGEPIWGGDWEYHVDVQDKFGNKLVRPSKEQE